MEDKEFNGLPEAYAKFIKNYKPLSRSEELDLVRRAQWGYGMTSKFAKRDVNNFLEQFMGLVVKQAHKSRSSDLEDAIHDGVFGLFRALEKYDHSRINPETNQPYRFSTYANSWIRHSIRKLGLNAERKFLPASQRQLLRRIYRVRDEFSKNNSGQNPSAKYISDFLNKEEEEKEFPVRFTSDRVEKLLNLGYVSNVASLNDIVENDSEERAELIDFVPADVECPSSATFGVDNAKLLGRLSDRDLKVIYMRFYEDATLQSIGDVFNLTRERVRQIENKALKSARARAKID